MCECVGVWDWCAGGLSLHACDQRPRTITFLPLFGIAETTFDDSLYGKILV